MKSLTLTALLGFACVGLAAAEEIHVSGSGSTPPSSAGEVGSAPPPPSPDAASQKVQVKDPMSTGDMEADVNSESIYEDGAAQGSNDKGDKDQPQTVGEPPEAMVPPSAMAKVEPEQPLPLELRKVFYINMDKDTDRRERITEQLRMYAANLEHVRVQGISTDDLQNHPDYVSDKLSTKCCAADRSCEAMFDKDIRNWRSCCCDFSHRKAYEQIAQQDDGLYLVIEDDVEFEPEWQSKLREAWAKVPADWDVLRLGFWGDMHPDDRTNDGPWLKARRDHGKWPEFKGYYGAHAVLLTPGKARSLLEKIKGAPLDYADRFTKQTKQLNNYVLDNCIVCVVTDESNMPTGSSSRMEASTSFSLLTSGSSVVLDITTGRVKLGGNEVQGLSVRKSAPVTDANVDQLKTMDDVKVSKTDGMVKGGNVASLIP